MSPYLSPSCLHWSGDGELTATDRQDLFRSLALGDNRLAYDLLTKAMPKPECASQPARSDPAFMPS